MSIMPLEFAFGARYKTSDRYSWNGAVVFYKIKGNKTITATSFQNGRCYTANIRNYNSIVEQYKLYLRVGYNKMDKDDIEKTANITIDKNTLLSPNRCQGIIKQCTVPILAMTSYFVMRRFFMRR